MANPKVAKSKNKQMSDNAIKQQTLSELKGNAEIWYKIKVLIHDLCNIKNDRSSEMRLDRTVDELYISAPYFTTSEAALVKATLVEVNSDPEDIIDNEEITDNEDFIIIDDEVTSTDGSKSTSEEIKTVEEAIKERLRSFYDKRKASGDFRPCGPHDMAPVYLSIFGILRCELEDERFLGRLRRSGLDESQDRSRETGLVDNKKKGKKGR